MIIKVTTNPAMLKGAKVAGAPLLDLAVIAPPVLPDAAVAVAGAVAESVPVSVPESNKPALIMLVEVSLPPLPAVVVKAPMPRVRVVPETVSGVCL